MTVWPRTLHLFKNEKTGVKIIACKLQEKRRKLKDFSNLLIYKFVSALYPQTWYAQKAAQKWGKNESYGNI